MPLDFVVYRVHIHEVNQEELYKLLESMPKSTRGLYIREALEHYRRTRALTVDISNTSDISLRGAFDQDFSATFE
jgi:hypothetical protein